MSNTEMNFNDFWDAASVPRWLLGVLGKLAWGGYKNSRERAKVREMQEQLLEKGYNLSTAKQAWLNGEIDDKTYSELKSILSNAEKCRTFGEPDDFDRERVSYIENETVENTTTSAPTMEKPFNANCQSVFNTL